jgi:hypothetical protein
MKGRLPESVRQILANVSDAFTTPIQECGDAVLAGQPAAIERHLTDFPGDPTALESFVNHLHIEDLTTGMLGVKGADRLALLAVGRALIHVWAERIRHLPRPRAILFYLGGLDTVGLRFHVFRDQKAAWLDLTSPEFIRGEAIEVYLADAEGIRKVAP